MDFLREGVDEEDPDASCNFGEHQQQEIPCGPESMVRDDADPTRGLVKPQGAYLDDEVGTKFRSSFFRKSCASIVASDSRLYLSPAIFLVPGIRVEIPLVIFRTPTKRPQRHADRPFEVR